jgi:glycosyltransferase involved in cell wall biosynthesis
VAVEAGATPVAPRERLRIARIIDRLNVGGPAKHVVWLTAGLRDHDTLLLAGTIAAGEGDMAWFAHAAGVRPVAVDGLSRAISPRDALVVWRIYRQLRRFRPDVVHTHKAKAGTVGRVATLLYRLTTPSARCRVVHTYHGHIFHSYYGRLATRAFIAIERLLGRLATDVVVTLSPAQRRDITERYRIAPPGRVRIVPLGIDLAELDGPPVGLRAALGLPADGVLVGTVGRLCEVKDQALFLDGAALLARDRRDVRFAVVGDGHLRGRLEARARDLGIRDAVAFLGFRDDAPRLYPELDVVALTSRNEGTPVTLLEAMAAGRAVATTEVGGVPDILGARRAGADGFTVWEHGVSVASRDPAAFARALGFLVARPELRRAMGERGRAFVADRMSVARLVSDVEKLYRELHGRDTGVSAHHGRSGTRAGEGVDDEGADHRRGRIHRLASG